ncbi:monocyte chemotactic protein 1B-like [Cynoglossus semilaevis]|uniref:C-C motif chemokine n=1 Tax=Cynoglossus semilaevis TaxID=244447 RepID=A0A3P8W9S4_CYNSE|nr:monocyte chemotactic protein 1B-like [Cynoglossus semilaevis]
MKYLCLAALVLVATMVSTVTAQGGIASCCRRHSKTQINREHLTHYYEQHRPPCPIKAVVFYVIGGARICADPNKVWTKTSKAFLDGVHYQRQHTSSKVSF